MTASALDDVPGLGATRRKALLRHFGSLKRLARPPPRRSPRCPGSAPRTAAAVVAARLADGAPPAHLPRSTPPTGEILDG